MVQTSNCRKPDESCKQHMADKELSIHIAEVFTDKDDTKVYIGVTANTFKERSQNLTKSFKNKRHGNETDLSNTFAS